MKGCGQFRRVSKISSRFPAVMALIIAFPFNQILILVTILTTIKDGLDFILIYVVNMIRRRRGGREAIDCVTTPWGKAVYMKGWVLTHRGGKI
jgi:hypothetical protein